MKKATGALRINLAQFREMEVFTQFSSDLDPATKELLDNGRALIEILKQNVGNPLSMPEQVISLVAANEKLFMGIPLDQVKKFQTDLLKEINENYGTIISELKIKQELPDGFRDVIIKTVREYKEKWLDQQTSKTE